MTERVVELTDQMLNAGAEALDQFDGPIPADHHERWGVVSLVLVAALREAPYPAARPEAASGDEITLTIRQDDAEMLYAHLCNDIPPGVEGGWRDRILPSLEDGFSALEEQP